MKETWSFERCVSVINGEIELLKRISATQEAVRQTVMKREWTDFDEKSREINRLGGEFALLEEERTLLFSALSNGSGSFQATQEQASNTEKTSFYTLILELPSEERKELSRLYRELKVETFKMRALNETFLAYVNEAKILAASYLEVVCPARGGKLYTRKGRRVSQDLKSIVFNNRF